MTVTIEEGGVLTITEHPGWSGVFTRNQYPGALANGTRVRKRVEERGDAHKIGDLATVLGSIGHPDVGVGYFVEWDDLPRMAVFLQEHKVEENL